VTKRKRTGGNGKAGGVPMPKVPPGAIKAIPKSGESEADALARIQARHSGQKVVDPPKYGRSNGRERGIPSASRGIEITGPREVGAKPWRLATPILHPSYSGRSAATQILRDQYATSKIAVYVTDYAQPSLIEGGAAGVGASWFQTGSAAQDSSVNLTLGGVIQQTYQQVVRQYMATKGRMFPTFTLGNAGTGAQVFAIAGYLNRFIDAFMMCRNMEGLLNIGDFNFSCQLISGAAMQRMPQIQAVMNRLRSVPVPQMLVDCLDLLCGPKAWDDDSPLVIANAYGSSSAVATDLSLPASLDTILSAINNNLNQITTGFAGLTAADMTAISQIFALCYGFPHYTEKVISFDKGEWALITNTAITNDNDTTNLLLTYPNTNDSNFALSGGAVVPILHPKGVDNMATKLLYSLFRNAAYSVDAVLGVTNVGAVANQVGLFPNQKATGAHGTVNGLYNQTGGFSASDNHGAGFTPLTFQFALLDLYPWASQVQSNVTGPTGVDARIMHDYDRVYVTPSWLLEETVDLWEHMFLDF
jgi:hypothetical protein